MKNQQFHIIAIEREYASGGHEIGELAAKRLGIPCYGREILQMAAKELGMSVDYLKELEEKSIGSFMYSMYVMASLTKGNVMWGESKLCFAESEIINRLTQTPAVIVGRCAANSLSDREDVLRVFIHGDEEFRKERAHRVYGIPEESASDTLKRADKRRAGYYKANTGRDWRDSSNYHVILDSGLLGIEKCADILEVCLRKGGSVK